MTFGFDRVVVRVLGYLCHLLPGLGSDLCCARHRHRRRNSPPTTTWIRHPEEPLTFGSDVAEHVTGASFHLFNSAQQEWNRDLLRPIRRGGASYGISPPKIVSFDEQKSASEHKRELLQDAAD